jgi:hypothetical protein
MQPGTEFWVRWSGLGRRFAPLTAEAAVSTWVVALRNDRVLRQTTRDGRGSLNLGSAVLENVGRGIAGLFYAN